MTEDWKDKLGSAFGVDINDIKPEEKEEQANDELEVPAKQQVIYVELDRKGRKGKAATIITGFRASEEYVKELSKELKTSCGAGGSSRGAEILIQGDFVNKIMDILRNKDFKVKRIGG